MDCLNYPFGFVLDNWAFPENVENAYYSSDDHHDDDPDNAENDLNQIIMSLSNAVNDNNDNNNNDTNMLERFIDIQESLSNLFENEEEQDPSYYSREEKEIEMSDIITGPINYLFPFRQIFRTTDSNSADGIIKISSFSSNGRYFVSPYFRG